jgi:hypothetical protein
MGNSEDKKILALAKEFQKLIQLIEKSPSQEFIFYLSKLDNQSKQLILERIKMTGEQLDAIANKIE